MNQLSPDKMADILEDLVERKSVRGSARTMRGNSKRHRKGGSINTVLKLLEDGGDAAIKFLDARMRKLPVQRVEADEVYAIVKMKPSTAAEQGIKSTELGAVWIWVALDPVSRLVVHWHVGGRTQADAYAFMAGLKARLAHKVQLTTDSLKAYPKAVEVTFDEIDYATVKKRDEEEERRRLAAELAGVPYRPSYKRKRLGDLPTEPEKPVIHMGEPDLALATTNHIEAFFGELRKDLGRMTRRTKLLSKTVTNLNRALALYFFHQNFVKRHSSLRGETPATASGIDDSIWTWDDFIVLVDDLRSERRVARKAYKAALLAEAEEAEEDTATRTTSTAPVEAEFCAFHNLKQDVSRLHRMTCRHLRLDPARAGKLGGGVKHPCGSLEEATHLAERLTPGRVETCKVCLGRYNARTYLGPR